MAERTSNDIEKRALTDLAMTWVMMVAEVERVFAPIKDSRRSQVEAVNG
jgi:hypothetical protein